MHFDVTPWLLLAVGLATSLGAALVRIWGRIGSAEQRDLEHGKAIDELKKRVDSHDDRIGKVDTALARIEAGIDFLKEAIGRVLGRHE